LHSSEAQFSDEKCRDILVETAFGDTPTLVNVKRVISLISHRLTTSREEGTLARGLLLLLACVVERASSVFSAAQIMALKEAIFTHSEVIRSYLVSDSISSSIREGKALFAICPGQLLIAL
jgi:hypothetical protein